jgi:hypothetical protein
VPLHLPAGAAWQLDLRPGGASERTLSTAMHTPSPQAPTPSWRCSGNAACWRQARATPATAPAATAALRTTVLQVLRGAPAAPASVRLLLPATFQCVQCAEHDAWCSSECSWWALWCFGCAAPATGCCTCGSGDHDGGAVISSECTYGGCWHDCQTVFEDRQ